MAEDSKKRRKLDEQDALKIVKEWGQKSVDQLAEELEVTANTVRAMVYTIRKEDSNRCPKKSRKTRTDIVRAALQMLKEEDRVIDN